MANLDSNRAQRAAGLLAAYLGDDLEGAKSLLAIWHEEDLAGQVVGLYHLDPLGFQWLVNLEARSEVDVAREIDGARPRGRSPWSSRTTALRR
jgi:hypothetical protein